MAAPKRLGDCADCGRTITDGTPRCSVDGTLICRECLGFREAKKRDARAPVTVKQLTCKDCRYAGPPETDGWARCRRRCPIPITIPREGIVGALYGLWPAVQVAKDWCGDFKRKINPDVPFSETPPSDSDIE